LVSSLSDLINMKRFFIYALLTCFIAISGSAQSDSVSSALKLFGLNFTQAEIDSLTPGLQDNLKNYLAIRKMPLPNSLPYAMVFIPPVNEQRLSMVDQPAVFNLSSKLKRPKNLEELAFYSVADLSVLIKDKKITSTELTVMYLNRLKRFADTLECVITLTEDLALAQAKRADEEIAAGNYRGPLHGIPYGAKDLLAVKDYPTTWGAKGFEDQIFDESATVIIKLDEAGAVLVAKLTLGALAWGDVWFGGVTKNPWNLAQGSSGSSAGSASATAAGLVPFAIGSETWGSIVSPSTRCGTTGLRPTFGRVSKTGAMALSWSMDKLGPICRNATDLAIVFNAINGPDGKDLEVLKKYPFNYNYSENAVKKLRVGYLEDLFDPEGYNYQNDSTLLALIRAEGVELIPKKLPSEIPTNALGFILSAEAAAAFDELTRSNNDDLLTRQIINAWPNVFRNARLIPAVEYIQANRLRYSLVIQFNEMMADIDVLITPSFGGDQMLMTNLTGHPCVVLPDGSYADGKPGTISLIGNLFDEASILQFARYLQEITPFEDEHPQMFQQ
jgi:Asp-tRNA(Asn)/Glu-tRNA(Gln) amidotransferase A subunit family amidase